MNLAEATSMQDGACARRPRATAVPGGFAPPHVLGHGSPRPVRKRAAGFCCAALLACIAPALGACADQMLGNDRARDSISGSLGLPAADVTIVGRRADGPTNTNFIVDTRANGRFVCTINGGNIATLGMTNGAACRRPGAA